MKAIKAGPPTPLLKFTFPLLGGGGRGEKSLTFFWGRGENGRKKKILETRKQALFHSPQPPPFLVFGAILAFWGGGGSSPTLNAKSIFRSISLRLMKFSPSFKEGKCWSLKASKVFPQNLKGDKKRKKRKLKYVQKTKEAETK